MFGSKRKRVGRWRLDKHWRQVTLTRIAKKGAGVVCRRMFWGSTGLSMSSSQANIQSSYFCVLGRVWRAVCLAFTSSHFLSCDPTRERFLCHHWPPPPDSWPCEATGGRLPISVTPLQGDPPNSWPWHRNSYKNIVRALTHFLLYYKCDLVCVPM